MQPISHSFGVEEDEIDSTMKWTSIKQKIENTIGDSKHVSVTIPLEKILEERPLLPPKPKTGLSKIYVQEETRPEPERVESQLLDPKLSKLNFKKMMGLPALDTKQEVNWEEEDEVVYTEPSIDRQRLKQQAIDNQFFAPSTDSAFYDSEGYSQQHPEGPSLKQGYNEWARNYPKPSATRKNNDIRPKQSNPSLEGIGVQSRIEKEFLDTFRLDKDEKEWSSYAILDVGTASTSIFEPSTKTEVLFNAIARCAPDQLGVMSRDTDVSRTLQDKEEIVKDYIFRIAHAVVSMSSTSKPETRQSAFPEFEFAGKSIGTALPHTGLVTPSDPEESLRQDVEDLRIGQQALFVADAHAVLDHEIWELPQSHRDSLALEIGRLLSSKNKVGENNIRGNYVPYSIKKDAHTKVRASGRTNVSIAPLQSKHEVSVDDTWGLRERIMNLQQLVDVKAIAPTLERQKMDKKENTRQQHANFEMEVRDKDVSTKEEILPKVRPMSIVESVNSSRPKPETKHVQFRNFR